MPAPRRRAPLRRAPPSDPRQSLADIVGGDLGPTPDGRDLVARVRCSTSRNAGGRYEVHEAVIHPDWSATVPHDLEAERVARAFGGGVVGCVDLLDHGLSAVRECVQVLARRALPAIVSPGVGLWASRPRARGCCVTGGRTVKSPLDAAAHVRDAHHVSASHVADVRVVEDVTAAVLDAHRGVIQCAPHPAMRAAGSCVPVDEDLDELWGVGIHPALVTTMHRALRVGHRPLPASLYLELFTSVADLRWVHDNVVRLPSDALPYAGRGALRRRINGLSPDQRAMWLASGVPEGIITALYDGGYTSADLEHLAHATGRTGSEAADALIGWLDADCRPTRRQLLELHAAGISPFHRPSGPAISRVHDALAVEVPYLSRTENALLLAAAGSLSSALSWVRAGYTDPVLVARSRTEGQAAPTGTSTCAQ